MDIQKIISDVLAKLEGNENLISEFTAEPVKTLEKLTGLDLPDDQINAIIAGIKAKLNLNETAKEAKGMLDGLKGLFGKK